MNKDIKAGLAWAAAILAVAFAAILARQAGYIDADAARRSATVMIGLMVAQAMFVPAAIGIAALARAI
jgi:hypothetical protein